MSEVRPQDELEVIVLTVEDAERAAEGGATRLEVVRDIGEDGLTPAVGLVEQLLARVRLPLRVMVRPRNLFVVGDDRHRDEIVRDAALFAEQAPHAHITVHRAIERVTADPKATLRGCPAVDRVLSGGGAGGWEVRASALAALQQRLAPLRVVVGGGVTLEGVAALAVHGELRELHVGRLARVAESFDQPVSPAAVATLRSQWFGRPSPR